MLDYFVKIFPVCLQVYFLFNFDHAYQRCIEKKAGDMTYYIVGLEELIAMKLQSNRYRDLSDAKELQEFRDQNSSSS